MIVSAPGDFPSYVASDLPLHPLVADFRRDGTPWIFTHLPIELASVINKYRVALLVVWVLVAIRREVEELTGLRRFLFESAFRSTLLWVRLRLKRTGQATPLHIWLVRKIAAWVDHEEQVSNLKAAVARLHQAHPDILDEPGQTAPASEAQTPAGAEHPA